MAVERKFLRLACDLKLGITLYQGPQIFAQRHGTQLERIPEPADGNLTHIELTHGGCNSLQTLTIGREMNRRTNSRRRLCRQRVDPCRIPVDLVQ